MAKRTVTQIASLFQNFDQQIKDHEVQIATAHQSSQQLRASLRDIMLEVVKDYKSLRQ